MNRVATIAKATLLDLIRQKVFSILFVFGLVAVGSSIFLARLSFQEEFQMLKDVCLGAMSVFTSLLAIFATASFIPKDLEERTIYTLLAKPVPRWAYLAGKLLGILVLLFAFTLVMACVSALVLGIREATVLAEIQAEFSAAGALDSEEAEAAIQNVRKSTFNPGLLAGVGAVFIKACVLASVTLLVSTFATSTLFSVMVSAAIYFIGHLQSTARNFWLEEKAAEIWQKILVAIVALIFPDLQIFNLADDAIAGASVPISIFLRVAALGGIYLLIYFGLASLIFSNREL